jgi:zinc finger HIT domain-containing protein 1
MLVASRVASLEKDIMEEEAYDHVEDDDTISSTPGAKQRKKKRSRQEILSKTNVKRTLPQVIAAEAPLPAPGSAAAAEVVNYSTIEAGPSKQLPRRLCEICGGHAPYRCIRCGDRYCTVKCAQLHCEERCVRRG